MVQRMPRPTSDCCRNGEVRKHSICVTTALPLLSGSDAEPRRYHKTIKSLVGSGYVFSRIDVNQWSTIMHGLVAMADGTAITTVQGEDVQCCYEAIITHVGRL